MEKGQETEIQSMAHHLTNVFATTPLRQLLWKKNNNKMKKRKDPQSHLSIFHLENDPFLTVRISKKINE